MMVPPGQFPGPGHNNNHILPPTGQMGMMVPSGQFPGPGHNNNTLPSMGQMSPGMMPSYPPTSIPTSIWFRSTPWVGTGTSLHDPLSR